MTEIKPRKSPAGFDGLHKGVVIDSTGQSPLRGNKQSSLEHSVATIGGEDAREKESSGCSLHWTAAAGEQLRGSPMA